VSPRLPAGDLKNTDVKASFGFDTACKVFSEMIGNIMIDAMSAKKYYHFVRCGGGRSWLGHSEPLPLLLVAG